MSDPIRNSRTRRPSRARSARAVAGGLVGGLPERLGSHELREPVAGFGRGLPVCDDAGEVVGQARQQAGLTGQCLGVGDRLGYDDHLPAVAAAALEDRDRAARGHLDHGAELVEHQRPRHAGLSGGVVEIGERQHGHRGRLVRHDVCVRPPHHDGARFERVDQADADRVTFRGDPRRHDLAACQRERDLASAASPRALAAEAGSPARKTGGCASRPLRCDCSR